jgi:hypothetical protein
MGAFLDFKLKWTYQGRSGEIKAGQESLLTRAFSGIRAGIGDWSGAFGAIVEDVLEPYIENQFESEGAAGQGLRWADLAPSTRARRADTTLLYVSGALSRSFRKGGGGHTEVITPKKLTWGSLLPRALFHQTGTGKGFGRDRVQTGPGTGRGMPRRRIFWDPLSEPGKALVHQMDRTLTGYATQIARRYGFGVTSPSERGALSPGEAARIGRIALGIRS